MRLTLVLLTSMLSACVHPIGSVVNAFPGIWYSGHAINKADYRTDDCSYKSDGTFSCSVWDRGCSGTFCDAQSFSYSGTWSLAGDRLTRQTTSGVGPKEPSTLQIRLNGRELRLSSGERWFKSKEARFQHMWDAL
jgi:hypothetical protein